MPGRDAWLEILVVRVVHRIACRISRYFRSGRIACIEASLGSHWPGKRFRRWLVKGRELPTGVGDGEL